MKRIKRGQPKNNRQYNVKRTEIKYKRVLVFVLFVFVYKRVLVFVFINNKNMILLLTPDLKLTKNHKKKENFLRLKRSDVKPKIRFLFPVLTKFLRNYKTFKEKD